MKKEEDEKRQKKKRLGKRLVNYFPSLRLCSSIYSRLKKEEEERQLEWSKKYRDRVRFLLEVTSYLLAVEQSC